MQRLGWYKVHVLQHEPSLKQARTVCMRNCQERTAGRWVCQGFAYRRQVSRVSLPMPEGCLSAITSVHHASKTANSTSSDATTINGVIDLVVDYLAIISS